MYFPFTFFVWNTISFYIWILCIYYNPFSRSQYVWTLWLNLEADLKLAWMIQHIFTPFCICLYKEDHKITLQTHHIPNHFTKTFTVKTILHLYKQTFEGKPRFNIWNIYLQKSNIFQRNATLKLQNNSIIGDAFELLKNLKSSTSNNIFDSQL